MTDKEKQDAIEYEMKVRQWLPVHLEIMKGNIVDLYSRKSGA
jgi:hypothetical protein